MKKMFRTLVFSAITALALAATTGWSQSNTAPATPTIPKPKGGATGFRQSTVVSVDTTAKTITIKNKTIPERVLKQDANTTLMVDGKPGTLADIKPGYFASGSLHLDGTNEVIVKGTFSKEKPMRGAPMGTNAPAVKAPAQ